MARYIHFIGGETVKLFIIFGEWYERYSQRVNILEKYGKLLTCFSSFFFEEYKK